MTFPVEFHLLGRSIPAHTALELAAYTVGVQTYLLRRRRANEPRAESTVWIVVFCVFGALFGSKLLAWMEMSPDEFLQRKTLLDALAGKTIVGGLIGGWLGVEAGKRFFGITTRTGDAYVLPLAIGICIGRVGCFLTGLADHTHGVATSLPWAVDFGDGIPRHPTQLYEIVAVMLISVAVWVRSVRPHAPGELFRWFMLGYFVFRLLVEFIKPVYRPDGLSAIQWACLFGIGLCAYGLVIVPTREVQRVG